MTDQKKYYVATARNWGAIEVEWFTDSLAYGRAVTEAKRRHERDEVDTFINGDNAARTPDVSGSLWIAHHGDDGLFLECFSQDDEYKARMLELRSNRRIDTIEFNGNEYALEPDVDDEAPSIGLAI